MVKRIKKRDAKADLINGRNVENVTAGYVIGAAASPPSQSAVSGLAANANKFANEHVLGGVNVADDSVDLQYAEHNGKDNSKAIKDVENVVEERDVPTHVTKGHLKETFGSTETVGSLAMENDEYDVDIIEFQSNAETWK